MPLLALDDNHTILLVKGKRAGGDDVNRALDFRDQQLVVCFAQGTPASPQTAQSQAQTGTVTAGTQQPAQTGGGTTGTGSGTVPAQPQQQQQGQGQAGAAMNPFANMFGMPMGNMMGGAGAGNFLIRRPQYQ